MATLDAPVRAPLASDIAETREGGRFLPESARRSPPPPSPSARVTSSLGDLVVNAQNVGNRGEIRQGRTRGMNRLCRGERTVDPDHRVMVHS